MFGFTHPGEVRRGPRRLSALCCTRSPQNWAFPETFFPVRGRACGNRGEVTPGGLRRRVTTLHICQGNSKTLPRRRLRTDGIRPQEYSSRAPSSSAVNSFWDQPFRNPLRTRTFGARHEGRCPFLAQTRLPGPTLGSHRPWFAPYLGEHRVVGARVHAGETSHLGTNPHVQRSRVFHVGIVNLKPCTGSPVSGSFL